MNFFFDTNILLHYIKKSALAAKVEGTYRPFAPENLSIISIVTEGELKSIAVQNNWGDKKIKVLEELLKQFLTIPIDSHNVTDKYAEVDAYSQGRLSSRPLPPEMSSRNMGKNDLWIAASASITSSTLLTTDGDFDHLNGIYFPVVKLQV